MQSVFEKFRIKRQRQITVAIIILPLVAGLVYLDWAKSDQVLGIPADSYSIMALIGVFAALAYSIYNWRCPSCNKYMGRNINPKSCPRCGVDLQNK